MRGQPDLHIEKRTHQVLRADVEVVQTVMVVIRLVVVDVAKVTVRVVKNKRGSAEG